MSSRLVELLERASSSGATCTFPDAGQTMTFAEIWSGSSAAAAWFHLHVERAGSVGFVLTTSPALIVALFGAWRAGLTVVSIPPPVTSESEYSSFVRESCRLTHTQLVIVEALGAVSRDWPADVTVIAASSCVASGTFGLSGAGGLVQFSSGSTSQPKGVVLSLDAVAANVEGVLAVMEPRKSEVLCSWLPLFHDMGLVGMLLTGWAGMYEASGGLVLHDTRVFLRRPRSWLRSCSANEATITAAPPSAYRLAAEMLSTERSLDLSSLRTCIVGAEEIDVESLQAFDLAAGAFGLPATSLSPCYGQAEATLAISMVEPSVRWRKVEGTAATGRARVASSGTPLPGVRVRAKNGGPGVVGELCVVTPSALRSYTSGAWPGEEGELWTSDLGLVDRGEVVVLGRKDDVLLIGGRKLFPGDVESAAARVRGVRPSRIAAIPDGSGGLAVLLEVKASSGRTSMEIANDISVAVSSNTGTRPRCVKVVPRGALPLTSSGKVRRKDAGRLLD